MMKNYFYFLSMGLALGAVTAWFLAVLRERQKKVQAIQALETKARSADIRAREFEDKWISAQKDIDLLSRSLNQEREANAAQVLKQRQTLKMAVLSAGGCFFIGMVMSAAAAWFWLSSVSELKTIRKMSQLEMDARIAETRAEIMGQRLLRLESDYEELRRAWFEALEEKTIAAAKLEILMEHIGGWKSGPLVLDAHKMKKSLAKNTSSEKAGEDLRFLGLPPPKIS